MDKFIVFFLLTNDITSLLEISLDAHVYYFVIMLVDFVGGHGTYV